MTIRMHDLTGMQLDALREIGNIGAGNAATSMSNLINRKINMRIPSVDLVSFDEMMCLLGGSERIIAAMYFRIYGDTPGTIYFILTIEEAESLVSQVTGTASSFTIGEQPEAIAVSALLETGNILAGAYLSALSDFTNLDMKPSVPVLNIDMAGAVLTAGLYEVSQISDYAMIIDTEIKDEKDGLNCHLLLMPEPESLLSLFSALGAETNV